MFLLQVVEPTLKVIRLQCSICSYLITNSNLRVHTECKMVQQIKPEAIPQSWTLIQVWTCITEFEQVIASIFYPSVSFPEDFLSLHKPLSCTNHVMMLQYKLLIIKKNYRKQNLLFMAFCICTLIRSCISQVIDVKKH